MTAIVREIDAPTIVARDLMCVIKDTIEQQPRGLQEAVGPSELGGCVRSLIHRHAKHRRPRSALAWKPFQGTALHAALADAFARHSINQGQQPRFLIEHAVIVGSAAGLDVAGHSDLFDIDSGTVNDWKLVGTSMLDKYRRSGPGEQYRVQAHLYGRGFERQGFVVRTVMITFLPRDGDLRINDDGSFTGAHVWAEPYDEQVAIKALARYAGVIELIDILGVDEVLGMYKVCNNYFCDWCKRDRPRPVETIELFGGKQ